MADNKGAQKLTELELGVSQIFKQLEDVRQEIEKASIESGKAWRDGFNKGMSQTAQTVTSNVVDTKQLDKAKTSLDNISKSAQNAKFNVSKILDETEIAKYKTQLDAIARSMGEFSKASVKQTDKGLFGSVTFDDKLGNKFIQQYQLIESEWKKLSTQQVEDIAKRQAEEQAALKEVQTLKDNFYKKNLSQIDAEIQERERQAKVFSAQLKSQMQARVQEEKAVASVTEEIDKQIEKQKQFNQYVSNQKTTSANKSILKDSDSLIKSYENLNTSLKNQEISASQAREQLASYNQKAVELGDTFDKTGAKGESFLQMVANKAGWLGAFYVVNELKTAFFESLNIIKETEDAVVSLQRVLNDDTVSQSQMSDELYAIAKQYGRTFDEVAEVSQLFVQAGNNWTDTLELTKGTMLALNTAELDVTQSTQGLIAIMAQWGLSAEDYIDLVDKINITADEFAVTSETIVSALQRSSSSAKNANISLEETIGIITALAEATGRSGENLGTALNSLIIYTSKSSALETFAKVGSDAMKQVVDDYQKGAVSIYQVWLQLSEELKNLSASQQASLFQSKDFQEFADLMESQAEEYTSQIKEVYGAAGTYRQNYFIALLNDLDKAKEAVTEMSGFEGYSVQENQKYMESLTASFNQLKASLAELAVQAGQNGILDFLKGLTEAGIGIAQVTKDMGGLLRVLTMVGFAFAAFKGEQISNKFLNPIKNSLTNAALAVSNFTTEIKSAETASQKFAVVGNKVKGAVNNIAGSFTTLVSKVSIVLTIFSVLDAAYNSIIANQERERQAILDSKNSYLEKTSNLYDLYSQYQNLSSQTELAAEQEEQLKNVTSQMISALDDKTKSLENLTQGTKEYSSALNALTQEQLKNNRVAYETNIEQAKKGLENYNKGLFSSGITLTGIDPSLYQLGAYKDFESEAIKNLMQASTFQFGLTPSDTGFKPFSNQFEDINKYIVTLAEVKAQMEDVGKTSAEMAQDVGQSKVYSAISSELEELLPLYEEYLKYQIENSFNQKAIDEQIPTTTDELNSLKSEIKNNLEISDEFSYVIDDIAKNLFPSLASAAEETAIQISDTLSVTTESIESLREASSALSSEIDNFQSAYDTINSAMEEYNQNGYLSVDTIQSLISMGAQYWDILNITANGISLNKNALGDLLNAQKNNIDGMIQQEAAAEILSIAQRYLSGDVDTAKTKMQEATANLAPLEKKLYDAAIAAMNSANGISQFNAELARLAGTQVTGSNYTQMQKEMNAVIQNAKKLSNAVGGISNNTKVWGNAATSAGNAASGGANKANEAQKKLLESQKEALEKQKEAVKERYDAEIEKLKEVEAENDRIRKKEEYYRNRQDILDDISKASTRSGVEYREQEMEARENLIDLDREWQETLEDWSIEDKISELEKLRDAEIAAIESQIEALQDKISALGNSAISGAGGVGSGMLDAYEDEFLNPAIEGTKTGAEEMIDELKEKSTKLYSDMVNMSISEINESFGLLGDATAKEFEMKFKMMQAMAENYSKLMMQTYEDNFFSKMRLEMSNPANYRFNFISPDVLAYNNAMNGSNPASNSIVSNRNTNIYANIQSESAANSLVNSFFTKP